MRPPFSSTDDSPRAEVARLGERLEGEWAQDGSAEDRAIWAAWTLIYGQAENTIRAAQAVRGDVISWQRERLKELLLRRVGGE